MPIVIATLLATLTAKAGVAVAALTVKEIAQLLSISITTAAKVKSEHAKREAAKASAAAKSKPPVTKTRSAKPRKR